MATDVIFKSILYGNCCILIQISLKYVSKVGAEIWRQVIIWTNDGIDYWCLYVRMYICTQRRWVNSCCFPQFMFMMPTLPLKVMVMAKVHPGLGLSWEVSVLFRVSTFVSWSIFLLRLIYEWFSIQSCASIDLPMCIYRRSESIFVYWSIAAMRMTELACGPFQYNLKKHKLNLTGDIYGFCWKLMFHISRDFVHDTTDV